jgi:hypothetical protein
VSRYFLITIIFLSPLISIQSIEPSYKAISYSSQYDKDIIEIGFRGGLGYRAKDRFENDLENFTSTYRYGVYSNTQVTGFRNLSMAELFLRVGISDNQRLGLVIGNTDFSRATLKEVSSDAYYTRLKFDIQTVYMLFTYHYLWNWNRQWGVEAGLGFGYNETLWYSEGATYSSKEAFSQQGRLSGNGFSYRMDSGINYRPYENFIFQLGILIGNHTVPSFNGSWNGASSTFAIREDGSTTPIAQSRVSDSILLTNQFVRSLDMNASYASIYFSSMLRFSY